MHTVYGIRAVLESIQAGKTVERILIKKGTKGDLVTELIDLSKKSGVHFTHVHPDRFLKFKNKNHQGVVAYVSPIVYQELSEVVQQAFEKGEDPLILVCDGITDVRNFGAIARSAHCFGVHGIVVPMKGGAAINADALKTSAGALNSIPVCKEDRIVNTINYLKKTGLTIVAATEKARIEIAEVDCKQPLAIVMGDEAEGISEQVLKLCDHKAAIPMVGEIASLNVSVSAGVMLYEVMKQRK